MEENDSRSSRGATGVGPGMNLGEILGTEDLSFLQQPLFADLQTFSAVFEVNGSPAGKPLCGPICQALLEKGQGRPSRLEDCGWKTAQEAIRTGRFASREFDAGLQLAAAPVHFGEIPVGAVVGVLRLPAAGTPELEALSSLHRVEGKTLLQAAERQPRAPEAAYGTGETMLKKTADFMGRFYQARVRDQELSRRAGRLTGENSASALLHRSLDLVPIWKNLEAYLRKHFDSQNFGVVITRPGDDGHRCVWHSGLSEPFRNQLGKKFPELSLALRLLPDRPQVIEHLTGDPRTRKALGPEFLEPFRSLAVFPMHVGRTELGAVILFFTERREFRAEELEITQDQIRHAAIAILNARSFQNEALLGRALRHLNEAVVMTDPRSRIQWVNLAAEKLFGHPETEIVGKSFSLLFSGGNPDTPSGDSPALEAAVDWKGDFVCRRRDGTTFPASLITSPVWDGNGNFVGISGVFRDGSNQKKKETEILQCLRDLQSMSDIGSFLLERVDSGEQLEAVLDEVLRIGGLTAGALFTADPPSGRLRVLVNRAIPESFLEYVQKRSVEEGFPDGRTSDADFVVLDGTEANSDCPSWFPGESPENRGSLAWIVLRSRGKSAGVLLLAAGDTQRFDPRLRETLAGIARKIAAAMGSSRMTAS